MRASISSLTPSCSSGCSYDMTVPTK
jgi:hypothetical protein